MYVGRLDNLAMCWCSMQVRLQLAGACCTQSRAFCGVERLDVQRLECAYLSALVCGCMLDCAVACCGDAQISVRLRWTWGACARVLPTGLRCCTELFIAPATFAFHCGHVLCTSLVVLARGFWSVIWRPLSRVSCIAGFATDLLRLVTCCLQLAAESLQLASCIFRLAHGTCRCIASFALPALRALRFATGICTGTCDTHRATSSRNAAGMHDWILLVPERRHAVGVLCAGGPPLRTLPWQSAARACAA